MGNYYYLISGLANISPDDDRLPYGVDWLREELLPSLSEGDRKLVLMALEKYDRTNLLYVLSQEKNGGDSVPDSDRPVGFYSLEQFAELIRCTRNGEPCKGLPEYMYRFASEFQKDEWQKYARFPEDRLAALFYGYADGVGNKFVREWFGFNRNMDNILTAMVARRHSLPVQTMIVGDDDVAVALRTSAARDWGLSQTLDCFDRLARLDDETDLVKREREKDMIRWNWLDENTFFHYFGVERIFAFVVRMDIVDRWLKLDRELGQKLFRSLIYGFKDNVEIPREFME